MGSLAAQPEAVGEDCPPWALTQACLSGNFSNRGPSRQEGAQKWGSGVAGAQSTRGRGRLPPGEKHVGAGRTHVRGRGWEDGVRGAGRKWPVRGLAALFRSCARSWRPGLLSPALGFREFPGDAGENWGAVSGGGHLGRPRPGMLGVGGGGRAVVRPGSSFQLK